VNKLRVCMAINAVLLLGAALPACADNYSSSINTRTEDAEIKAAVKSAIARHPDLSGSNQIYVATRDGVLYLSGVVGSALAIVDAEDVARQIPGVGRVVNSISLSQ